MGTSREFREWGRHSCRNVPDWEGEVTDGGSVSAEVATPGTTFGEMVRRYRLAAGMSQEELAERAVLSVRTLCDLERGRTTRPYRQTVEALATALSLRDHDLDEFVRWSRQGTTRVVQVRNLDPAPSGDGSVPRSSAGSGGAASVLRQLPAAVRHFTGSSAELDALTRMVSEGNGTGAVVISAVAGAAGVGKTATAVRWARLVAGNYPDGQLYVNLHGYDCGDPVAATDALAGFLRALGVPGTEIPDGADDRASLYRSRLAGRRVLVLLDNARDSEQVRLLLPGDPSCAAVITSRDALAGLCATDGARRLELDVLPLSDAVSLLRALIGPRADEPAVTAELASLCARLPLALRIAADLAVRSQTSLEHLVADLQAHRLDWLDTGDDRANIRAVFSWSIRQLSASAAETFTLIGLHPGSDLDAYATAALAGIDAVQSRQTLNRLHRANLLQATGPGRYGMHDLLRAYARDLAASLDAGFCEQADTRLLDYYLSAAAAAMDALFPAEAHQRPRISQVAPVLPDLGRAADARTWLDRERANLIATIVQCARRARAEYAAQLAGILFRYLMMGHHLAEAAVVYEHTLHAARQCGDWAAEAHALNGLGSVAGLKGRFRDAGGHYRAALECYCRLGDRAGEARVLNSIGITEQRLNNCQSAAGYHRRAIAVFQDSGDDFGTARALAELAHAEAALNLHDDAAEHLQSAMLVFRDAKDHVREAQALSQIGEISVHRGQFARAADCFEQSPGIFRRADHPTGIAAQLYNLGDLVLRQGTYESAVSYQRQALSWFRRAGDQYGEVLTLRSLAQALHGMCQPVTARPCRTGDCAQRGCGDREYLRGGQCPPRPNRKPP